MSILYLISSLPSLDLNSAPPIGIAEFQQRCAEWLSAKECAAIAALLEDQEIDHPFVRAWRDKESIMRNAIVHIRARAAGKDPSLYLRYAHGCDKKIESDVEDAVEHHDPLQMEREIDAIRWETVEELQGSDPLSINTLYAYAVKLGLVTRWSKLNKEEGWEAFDKLTEVPIEL